MTFLGRGRYMLFILAWLLGKPLSNLLGWAQPIALDLALGISSYSKDQRSTEWAKG